MRIGFTYNLKPAFAVSSSPAFLSTPGPEPDPLSPAPTQQQYAEWDSEETIDAVACALARAGEVVRLGAEPDLPDRLRAGRPDLVFNMAEGQGGRCREAQVPALLEFFGIPYTGGDALCMALTLDKAMTKRVLQAAGVSTPPFRLFEPGRLPAHGELRFPVIVKPVHEGSSIGVGNRSVCRSLEETTTMVREVHEAWHQAAIVEHFLQGREFTCALVGNGSTLEVYPPIEIAFDSLPAGSNRIYGYEAKWVWDQPWAPLEVFRCPAEVDPVLRGELSSTAAEAFRVLGCRDWARIDLRLDANGRVNVLEVNALPGVLPYPEQNSCYPKAARAAGRTFEEAILAVVAAARARHGV